MMIETLLAIAVLPFPREFKAAGGFVKDPPIVESRDKSLPPEGYRLTVGKDGAKISAADDRGAFYARVTLRQLAGDGGVPYCEVTDWPEYPLRMIHIDEGRHFFGKRFVLETLEWMAKYKLNTLHWHLTEDQGWRLPIDKYPNLRTWGATRNRTAAYGRYAGKYDERPYGPFCYTKEEVREVVAKARELKIDILPEVEMPGHSRAIVAAYPELGCPAFPLEERTCWTDWGICDDGVCAGNDDVLAFYRDVLDEVCEMFPDSKYIHMGGDERTTRNWSRCERCQARKKELGLARTIELQGWMMDQMADYLKRKGRKFAAYGCGIRTGAHLDPAETLLLCASTECGQHLALCGYKVVVAPVEYCYWDFNQSLADDPYLYGSWSSVSVPVNQVFALRPRTDVPEKGIPNIVGAVGYNWTEYTYSQAELEWKLWPRAIALSQALWNPMDGYAYGERFAPALVEHVSLMRQAGVNCADFQNGYRRVTTGGESADNQILKQD